MKKRLWKWLRNVLDSTATWIDVVERWFEGAALWIQMNKVNPAPTVPPGWTPLTLLARELAKEPPPEWRPVPTKPLDWAEFVEVTVEQASRIANIHAYYRHPIVETVEEVSIEEAKRRFPMVICTCRFQVRPIDESIYSVTTDPTCPIHGETPCLPSN